MRPERKAHLIINRHTGEVKAMEDDGVNYIQKLLIVPPDQVNSVQEVLNMIYSGNINDRSSQWQGS